MKREVVLFFVILWSMAVFAEDTELNLYRPTTDVTEHLPIEIVAKKSGECFQQSQLIKREDAWRCVAEGNVYDPCFANPAGPSLDAICAEMPWSNKGIQISVATPLENKRHESLDMSRTFPWAMELANGEKCQAIDTTAQYDGLPVRYQCDRNSELIGHVQRCESQWKMLQHAANGVDTVRITRAWF